MWIDLQLGRMSTDDVALRHGAQLKAQVTNTIGWHDWLTPTSSTSGFNEWIQRKDNGIDWSLIRAIRGWFKHSEALFTRKPVMLPLQPYNGYTAMLQLHRPTTCMKCIQTARKNCDRTWPEWTCLHMSAHEWTCLTKCELTCLNPDTHKRRRHSRTLRLTYSSSYSLE